VLFLAGGYEFVHPEAAKPPSQNRLRFMAKAFDKLHHDLLFVTPYERQVLAKAGVAPRPTWVGNERLEKQILHTSAGTKVAVLLLPPLPRAAQSIPQNLIHQVENAVHGLRGTVNLIVAMSPWGYRHEQELLKANGPLPDILLGSGPGIGLTGTLAAGQNTAWIRSFSQGKSIIRIEVIAWPERSSTFKWTEGKNIRMTLFGLTDQYQDNPEMLTLMRNMGTD